MNLRYDTVLQNILLVRLNVSIVLLTINLHLRFVISPFYKTQKNVVCNIPI